MLKHLFHYIVKQMFKRSYDLSIHLQACQLASVSVNWLSLDEIVLFRDRDLDFQTQRAIIYQKLHGKWNFFIRMHVKKLMYYDKKYCLKG